LARFLHYIKQRQPPQGVKTMNTLLTLTAVFAIILMSTSCKGTFIRVQDGALHLAIASADAKTLEPSVSMEPANFHISGFGPSDMSFDVDTSDSDAQIDNLLIGEWTIVVSAENDTGLLVGQGSSVVRIKTATVENASILLSPIDGTGSFDLTVNWDPETTDMPEVEGELLDGDGASLPLAFTAGSGTAAYISGLIDAGYYALSVQLKDNGIPVMGAVEVVRIVTGSLTSGVYDFNEINAPGGAVLVNITQEMADPIEVDLTGQLAEIQYGESMTVSAFTPSEAIPVVYTWYINCVSISVGGNIMCGQDLNPGFYRLDVTAFSTDGKRAGSQSHSFYVR
jgi:hypothetical protein